VTESDAWNWISFSPFRVSVLFFFIPADAAGQLKHKTMMYGNMLLPCIRSIVRLMEEQKSCGTCIVSESEERVQPADPVTRMSLPKQRFTELVNSSEPPVRVRDPLIL
jgi:hypothetical protein